MLAILEMSRLCPMVDLSYSYLAMGNLSRHRKKKDHAEYDKK